MHPATEHTDLPTGVTEENQAWWRLVMSYLTPKAEKVDEEHALTLARSQGALLPGVGSDDVLALALPTLPRAMLSSRANWEAFGHPPLAIFRRPDGEAWILICDLRPALAELARVQAETAQEEEQK